ncbi:MAG: hypothetical protein KDK45_10350, partial [Leptospiraceae bacterium]|nr:hypothetical protein [Leptospiraceae bacterium]
MRTQRFTAIIENNIRAIIIFISKYTSYVLGVTLFSAGIGGVTASLFALYFFDAVKVELSSYFMILLKICIFTVWTGSAYQFGLFYRLGLKGAYGKTLKTIHKFIEYRNRNIIIKENLQDEEYKELFKALIRFPKNIALTINIGITLILIGLLTFEISLEGLQLQKTLIILSVAFIAIFIVTCFSMVISEILTGELRAKCMEIMYEKNISIDKLREDAIYTVRTKLTYFIILFIINLLISNSITYSNRGNLNKVYSFSFLAVTASLFMAFLIFYIIYSALKQIESATYDLMKGGKGQLFLKTIDSEFVNLANGVNLAASTIREYQQNLENKVEERTMELNKSLGELARKDRMLATELDFAANIQKGILPLEED